jgi:hypothetical protein
MKQPAALFPIALALGAAIVVPEADAQAAPIPIKECQTISQPGSYVLERNLSTTGDCLVITASFVTINLAGFSISSSQGTGILVPSTSQLQGIAVRNGSISGVEGVTLSGQDLAGGADGSIVENLRIFARGTGIRNDGIRAKGIVRGNTLLGSGVPGTSGVTASGIVIDNYVTGFARGGGIGADGVVRGNTSINNEGGIFVSAGSTVIGNTAMNGVRGIQASCPANLTDNTAVNNATNLVLIGEGCHNEDNVAP